MLQWRTDFTCGSFRLSLESSVRNRWQIQIRWPQVSDSITCLQVSCKALNMITRFLTWILNLMCSQCEEIRTGVRWEHLAGLARSLAAAFGSTCKQFSDVLLKQVKKGVAVIKTGGNKCMHIHLKLSSEHNGPLLTLCLSCQVQTKQIYMLVKTWGPAHKWVSRRRTESQDFWPHEAKICVKKTISTFTSAWIPCHAPNFVTVVESPTHQLIKSKRCHHSFNYT